jgi:hypothetical protein
VVAWDTENKTILPFQKVGGEEGKKGRREEGKKGRREEGKKARRQKGKKAKRQKGKKAGRKESWKKERKEGNTEGSGGWQDGQTDWHPTKEGENHASIDTTAAIYHYHHLFAITIKSFRLVASVMWN